MSEQLNELIKEGLKRKKVSQRTASLNAGLSEHAINEILRNPGRSPDPRSCIKLARYFGWDEDRTMELVGHRTPQEGEEKKNPNLTEVIAQYYGVDDVTSHAMRLMLDTFLELSRRESKLDPAGNFALGSYCQKVWLLTRTPSSSPSSSSLTPLPTR